MTRRARSAPTTRSASSWDWPRPPAPQVISTTTSFRTMQPVEGQPIRFGYIDRTIGAARSAGLQVRLQLVGMPDWALDDPQDERQAPRSDAELAGLGRLRHPT